MVANDDLFRSYQSDGDNVNGEVVPRDDNLKRRKRIFLRLRLQCFSKQHLSELKLRSNKIHFI